MKRINLLLLLAILGTVTMSAREFEAVADKTEIKWSARKVAGEHYGYINLKSGSMKVENDKIINGSFIIDMTSITVTDIENAEYNQKLVGHLKSDDFFSVEKHSESKLEIIKASEFNDGKADIKANLTIKGKTHPVEFTAVKSGENLYDAKIVVDRTKYDIRYGSGKFFSNLGDNMIYDEFTLHVKLKAN